MNLVNYKVTPPHAAFDECVRLAEAHGARVTGSELVGLIPLEAMLQAGRHYLAKQRRTAGVPESELIHIAALSMGMSDLYPFDPAKKIIEYQFRDRGPSRRYESERVHRRSLDGRPGPRGRERRRALRGAQRRPLLDGRRPDARQEGIRDLRSRRWKRPASGRRR